MWTSVRAPMTDDELAEAFVAHQSDALDEAYRRHAPLLISVARRVLTNGGDAEDCVHDALMRVWSNPGSYRRERGALRAFLVVCVRNDALARRRSAARHLEIEERVARDNAVEYDDSLERSDPVARAHVAGALAALPVEQRRVIELAYFDGHTQTEIAAILHVPLGTIKSRASMGLRKLALALAPEHHV